MQLVKKIFIKGFIKPETGLRVGGSKETIEIGGVDLSVIKLPNGLPYIPGSSIKGKMRCLLERSMFDLEPVKKYWEEENQREKEKKGLKDKLKKVNDQEKQQIEKQLKDLHDKSREAKDNLEKLGWKRLQNIIIHTCPDPNCPICLIFGRPAEVGVNQPTRLFVRDAHLIVGEKELEGIKNEIGFSLDIELFEKVYPDLSKMRVYTEIKTENVIDRLTSAANPRKIERVPAGVVFEFELIYNVFDGDDEKLFEEIVLKGLRLLEDDYIGGMGSRGYGKIKFIKLYKAEANTIDYTKPIKLKFEEFLLRNSYADN